MIIPPWRVSRIRFDAELVLATIRPARRLAFLAISLLGVVPALPGRGQPATVASAPGAEDVITDPASIWAMKPEEKNKVHPLRIEGRVNYVDPLWKMVWLEKDGVGTYVQLAAAAPAMKIGQRVRIDGTIVPEKGLEVTRAQVTVLREFEPIEPLPVAGRINDLAALNSHVVTGEAYVDGEQSIDPEHLRLTLIVENRPVIGWVKPSDPAAPLPAWQGRFVRFTGLYSERFDPTHTTANIEIWMGDERGIRVVGTIDDHPRFALPLTAVDTIYLQPAGTWVHVRGQAENHEIGNSMVIRDETGQVKINSIQKQRIPTGATVEAVGRVAIRGAEWIVDAALYRLVRNPAGEAADEPAAGGPLQTIDQIRQLSVEEAAQGRPVKIVGMVTWSLPESDFFFLQDAAAGIRVHFDRATAEPPLLGKYLEVDGVTTSGDFAPVVELRRTVDLGSMSPPEPPLITFDEAISGKEDGQFVAMRGFLQRVVSDHDWRWIQLTTPAGDFVGHLQSPVNFVANPGSLVRLRGVCETAVDANGRITGVTLRVPFLHDIAVEEDAPADPFDLPLRSLKAVNHFSGGQNLMRVRVAGTVIQASPGRQIYIEAGESGLLLLSPGNHDLSPGDRIEAVGILGHEGARTILRQADYRKTGTAPAPRPAELTDPGRVAMPLDSRLVRAQGTLIDAFERAGRVRLTLQSGATLFEAMMDRAGPMPTLTPGEGLELTGVYRVVVDDARQSRGFELQLRSPADIVVYRPAEFWNARRALAGCGILGGAVLLGLAWITALRRRVHRQTAQLRAQLERQARLEAEVQRAARLESLGTLAGGIAHDFNNILTIVLGNATLAMSDPRAMHAVGESLKEIERGSRRARELTQQLLTFAKGGTPHRAAVAVGELVREEVEPMIQGTAVRCDYDLPLEKITAELDRDQIARTLRAIVLNALQAMPRGGRLRITLRTEEIAAGAHHELAAGRYAHLAIADSGEGIAADVLPKIFDPYFTTKNAGGGLGLATAYSVVRKHEGRIEAESVPGHGATVHLWLPIADEAPAAAAKAAIASRAAPAVPSAPAPTRARRVLLMDDEESIRRVVEIVLQRMGLDPVVVADGEAAIKAFHAARDEGRPIDLLILDLTIPGGLGGRQVMEIIRPLAPDLPAIVSSGYSNDPVLARFQDFGFQAMVQKPYDVRQLAEIVGRFLGEVKPVVKPVAR